MQTCRSRRFERNKKCFFPRVKVSIVGSLRDREVACSASDRQGSNFESCVWKTVSSQSSHHPQEVLLAQFSLYVHKDGLKPDSFHFISLQTCICWVAHKIRTLLTWPKYCRRSHAELYHSDLTLKRLCGNVSYFAGIVQFCETQWHHRKSFWMQIGENNVI